MLCDSRGSVAATSTTWTRCEAMRRVLLIGRGSDGGERTRVAAAAVRRRGARAQHARRGDGDRPPARGARARRRLRSGHRGDRARARARLRRRVLLRPHPPAGAAGRLPVRQRPLCPAPGVPWPCHGQLGDHQPAPGDGHHRARAGGGARAGPILFQQQVAIGDDDTVGGSVRAARTSCSAGHLGRRPSAISTATRHAAGRGRGDYRCTRVPADGEIDWTARRGRARAGAGAGRPSPERSRTSRPPAVVWRRRRSSGRRWAGASPAAWPAAPPPRLGGRADRRRRAAPAGRRARGGLAVQPAADAIHSVRTTLGLRG